MDKSTTIESVAAVVPCQFCGKRKPSKIIKIHGCKERNYEDVTFLACLDCLQKIGTEITAAVNNGN